MPKWKYRTNFGSFLMKMIFYQGKVNLYNHCAHNKLRLHIILYYEIIIYRLVEGNIIATLSSRGREKSQFFFSITFRNYHVVLWGFDRFLPFIYVPIPQLTMKTCIIECNDKGYQVHFPYIIIWTKILMWICNRFFITKNKPGLYVCTKSSKL